MPFRLALSTEHIQHRYIYQGILAGAVAAGWDCLVFAGPRIGEFLRDSGSDVGPGNMEIVCRGDRSATEYYRQIATECRHRADLLVLDQPYRDLDSFLATDFSVPVVSMIHNVRTFLARRFAVRSLQRTYKRYLAGIEAKYTAFWVLTDHQKRWVERHGQTRKPVIASWSVISGSNLPDAAIDQGDQPVRFVLPGSINDKRRDYRTVLRAFEGLSPDLLERAELLLLGVPSPKKSSIPVIEQYESMKAKGVPVHMTGEWVSHDEYDRTLLKSSIIVASLRKRHEPKNSPFMRVELNGLTKVSAVTLDQIRLGLPVILPKHYPAEPGFENATFKYGSIKSLRDLMARYIVDEDLRVRSRVAARQASRLFTAEAMSEFLETRVQPLAGQR